MGCDIHAHVEIKIKGVWHHYSCPPIQRHYLLFEKICGVRGEIENAIAAPRGVPDDISIVTKLCNEYDGIDGHSHTWLNAVELDNLISWYEKHPHGDSLFQYQHFGYLNGGMFSHRIPDFEDCRFICWFDN